jgi:hypothetical protein
MTNNRKSSSFWKIAGEQMNNRQKEYIDCINNARVGFWSAEAANLAGPVWNSLNYEERIEVIEFTENNRSENTQETST